jgi:hypothetical protein
VGGLVVAVEPLAPSVGDGNSRVPASPLLALAGGLGGTEFDGLLLALPVDTRRFSGVDLGMVVNSNVGAGGGEFSLASK